MKYSLLLAAMLSCVSTLAVAQVVERNLPPAPPAGPDLAVPNAVAGEQDNSPIGPALAGIVLLGPQEAVRTGASPGVDARGAGRLAGEPLRAKLAAYLGRPLSRRLIAEVEAEIARHYRARGFPFVALATPAQEVTTGTLQIRVVEFHAGDIRVTGASRTPQAYVADRIRQPQGAPINAQQLGQDLDWLNRNPFRTTEAIFSPGDALGRSDMTLAVTETKPWRVYAGAATSDARATGRGRLFAGVQAAPITTAPDAILSYQFTASDDLFAGGPSRYRSHAVTLDLGIAPRQAIEVTVDQVVTNQSVAVFDAHQTTTEARLGWRGAAGALGDLTLGIEARRSERKVSFANVPIIGGEATIVQLYLGAERTLRDPLGDTQLSATAHFSPGGIGDRNNDAALTAFSNGRVTDARYAYLDLGLTRATRIGQMQLTTELIGRLATGSLPDTEQIGIGGASLVRGYLLDDGAYDTGIVARNTLSGPSWSPSRNAAFTPYAFVDAGYAHAYRVQWDVRAVSVGVGSDVRLGRFVTANAAVVRALSNAPRTHDGDWRAVARISFAL